MSDAFGGRYWPDHPTLENYRIVLTQDHFFLQNFWLQLGNSVLVAFGTMALVLVDRQHGDLRHQPAQAPLRPHGLERGPASPT